MSRSSSNSTQDAWAPYNHRLLHVRTSIQNLIVSGKFKLTRGWRRFFFDFEETLVYSGPASGTTFLCFPRLFPLFESCFLFFCHPLRILAREIPWLAAVSTLGIFDCHPCRLCKSRFADDASEPQRMDSLNVVAE